MRSSIRSRSTSHNLSDENKSLSICSASADSSPFKWFVCHTSDRLPDCRDRSLHRDVRLRLCSHRADPISYPFLINWFLSRSSHQSIGAVVPNSWAVRARIFHPVKLPNGSSGSKNSHAGHWNPKLRRENLGRICGFDLDAALPQIFSGAGPGHRDLSQHQSVDAGQPNIECRMRAGLRRQ